jgi:hypothetical protein
MPINTVHPLYTANSAKWRKCRDAYDGEDAVKAAGTVHLPALSSMTGDDDPKYIAYKQRAMFYGATHRTVEGLVGMVTRKAANIEVPDAMSHLLEDATGTGINMESFIANVLVEVLLMGRYSVHVDRPFEGGKAYLVGNTAESTINWSDDYIVIAENYFEPDPKDKYNQLIVLKYREFYLEEGILKARLWEKDTTGNWNPTELAQPTKRGDAINFIPQVFISPYGISGEVVNSPLLSMVNVNMSHYRTYADLEHGRHFTALPTPYATGVDMEKDENGNVITQFNLGSEGFVLFPNANTKAGFIEFTGSGLTYLENAIKEKSDLMAVLGARLLQNQKLGVESAETARINKSGDTSIVASIAGAVESGIKKALEYIRDWDGLTGEVVVELNKDLLEAEINPQLLTALMQSWQAGGISLETFLYNVKRAELLPPDVDVETEIQKIHEQMPNLGLPGEGTNTGAGGTGSGAAEGGGAVE